MDRSSYAQDPRLELFDELFQWTSSHVASKSRTHTIFVLYCGKVLFWVFCRVIKPYV